MDDACLNHYEQQLYTVFKTFDVDNEEALDRAAVLQLCDALQLEARGAALVDSLFERRAERVTFATFRNGLLSVLGASAPAEPEPAPSPEPAPEPPAPAEPAQSDDDSSGREVAPKFVYGSKKYGRRSRPVRGGDSPGPRAASASRLEADAGAARSRMRFKRSASAMEARADRLDHDRRIDRVQAVALCRDLRMDSIDPRLVNRIFDDSPSEETTVGDFFDRLNSALTPLASAGEGAAPPAEPPDPPPDSEGDDNEDPLSGETVAEAWERAGVRRPRRLLAELGFGGASLGPAELERALDDELRALGSAPDERDARPLLQAAALALSRLRRRLARARAGAAAAERDKLRADLAEANRRARLLAQDVDEGHARLEAERQAALRQLEARHAEASRAAAAERAAERERAAAARAALEAELARRGEAEARLRAELAALRLRADALEGGAALAEERAAGAEREAARAAEEARAAGARAADELRRERGAREALARQVRELRAEGARLRDRVDELQAGLEARAPPAPAAPPAAETSWRDEAADALGTADAIEECDSSPPSIEQRVMGSVAAASPLACPRCAAPAQTADASVSAALVVTADASVSAAAVVSVEADAQTDPAAAGEHELRARLDQLQQQHELEKNDLNNLITELEGGLEELRAEYERCEEYWAGKLADERALAAAEAAAGDERLAELARRVAEYERQFRPRLSPLPEAELEPQYEQLQQEFSAFKAEAARELAAAREAAAERARAQRDVAPPACACRQVEPAARSAPAPTPGLRADGVDSAMERRSASAGAVRGAARGGARGPGGDAFSPAPHPASTQHTASSAGACAGADGRALVLRAAHAERAARRLLARLLAADALVADLYRENCQLAHRAPPPHHPLL